MTNFEKIKSMNIEELVNWLDSYKYYDESPWFNWWNDNYCNKCEPIQVKLEDSKMEIPCAWCELHKGCRFFQDKKEVPNDKDIIQMWLGKEVE